MFDFAWSEFALIGVVALVAIGPKDMPVAIKTVAGLVKKARRMAGEFQGHLDELMKEADLGEMRGHLAELRSFNLRDQVTRAVDPDGSLRNTLAEKPFTPATSGLAADHLDGFVGSHPATVIDEANAAPAPSWHPPSIGAWRPAAPDHLRPAPGSAPAFIPPDAVAAEQARQAAPAFIPPAHAARGQPAAA